MGAVKLSLRCPESVQGIAVDPEPDWSLDDLLSELNSLELNLNTSHVPFTKTKRGSSPTKRKDTSKPAFTMHISDDDIDDDEGEVEEPHNENLTSGRRFACDELYLSDSDDSDDDTEFHLMDEVGLGEGALIELTHERQLWNKEEVRNEISALQTALTNASEKCTSALVRVEKYREARREMDRKIDMQYQRKIAEELDKHLTAIQREHEHKSQKEERQIRKDAASEEAKRRDEALREEKLNQERARAEARLEAAKKQAEIAAMEAKRREEKEAAEALQRAAADVAKREAAEREQGANLGVLNVQSREDRPKKVQPAGQIVKSSENALKLEEGRLQRYKEIDEQNQLLRRTTNKDFGKYELKIARMIKQVSGTKESVRAKSNELIKIFNDPLFHQAVGVAMFAKKVVSHCESPSMSAFACAHVIVLVTSQFPLAIDLLLAEFHRACIYTVPKYIHYSESSFETKEAYYKTIGYQEEDGKIESTSNYLKRVEAYMNLYGTLVQTEVEGVRNLHGLEAGWSWLSRFLNALPANLYTAVALDAFLDVAGFAMFRKYKSQFRKLMNIISKNFLDALKGQGDSELNPVIAKIESYVEKQKFLEEPKGWRLLHGTLSSSAFVPESGYHDSYHSSQSYYG